jgi:hypothetical protein
VHSDTVLGGPVWVFAQVVIFGTLLLSLFVFVDSLMPRRRQRVAGRLSEPLWVYSAVNFAYLVLLVSVQLIPGLQMAAAAVAVASPIVLVFGVVYLLRVVFPKVPYEAARLRSESAETTAPASSADKDAPASPAVDDGPFDEV